MAVATVTNLYGQGVVGQQITCPWLTGASYEITQGWGPTNVQSEPAEDRSGKHYSHWHAGVDLSSGSITTDHIVFPHGLGQQARVVYLNNPNGYGTALILQMFTQSYAGHAGGTAQVRNADIYLGHLATRLAKNGQVVRDGDVLAVPDSTGNSTGPHLHFEVRSPDGKYGTDMDPSQWLLQGNAALTLPNLNPLDALGSAITQAEQSVMNTVVGLAQTALGGSMMLAGGVSIGLGLRGMTPARALGVTRRTARGLGRRRPEFDLTRQRRDEVAPVSAAGRTRLRPSLRREVPATPAAKPTGRMTAAEYETSLSGLSLQRQRALVAGQPRTRAEARGMVPMRYGVPIRGKEARTIRRALPQRAA